MYETYQKSIIYIQIRRKNMYTFEKNRGGLTATRSRKFITWVFARAFQVNYFTKIYPCQKYQLSAKMEGLRSHPSNLLYIYPFLERYILVKYFALKTQAKTQAMNISPAELQQLVYPLLLHRPRAGGMEMGVNKMDVFPQGFFL